jgi:hypothetical protein
LAPAHSLLQPCSVETWREFPRSRLPAPGKCRTLAHSPTSTRPSPTYTLPAPSRKMPAIPALPRPRTLSHLLNCRTKRLHPARPDAHLARTPHCSRPPPPQHSPMPLSGFVRPDTALPPRHQRTTHSLLPATTTTPPQPAPTAARTQVAYCRTTAPLRVFPVLDSPLFVLLDLFLRYFASMPFFRSLLLLLRVDC